MGKTELASGQWQSGKKNIKMNLPVIIFEEDGANIVYCPALDLSGYGDDEAEARESFKIVLDEFFYYTTNKNTLKAELTRLGWLIKEKKYKPMLPPKMSDLLNSNDNFSRIFNNFPFRKINQQVAIPC